MTTTKKAPKKSSTPAPVTPAPKAEAPKPICPSHPTAAHEIAADLKLRRRYMMKYSARAIVALADLRNIAESGLVVTWVDLGKLTRVLRDLREEVVNLEGEVQLADALAAHAEVAP